MKKRKLLISILTGLCTCFMSASVLTACGVHTHSYSRRVTNATCSTKGQITYICTCGDSYTEDVPATGLHAWDNGTQTKAPTCAEKGVITYTCTVCGTATKTEPIETLPHEYSTDWSYNETHHYHECECGAKKDETKHTPSAPATIDGPQVCTVCDYVIQPASGILFQTLTVNGTKVYGKVSNETADFSFIDEVEMKGIATYVVDNDKDCNSPIKSKTVDLEEGDNVFYVLESIGNNVKLYTVTIHRRYMYDVTFNTNGGTPVEKQVVEEDGYAIVPTSTKAGYQLAWDYDFNTPITQSITITANWTPNTDTAYTVEYYLQNLDGSYPTTPNETYGGTGTTDTTAEADVKTFAHFTYDGNASTASGNIAGNGSLVLKLYYTRDSYAVKTSGNNTKAGTYTQINGDYRYEKKITLTATTNTGYTFLGWFDGTTCVSEDEQFTYNVEKKVTLMATWEANEGVAYKVEYYLQDVDGDYPTTPNETYGGTGTTDTTAGADVKTVMHFTYDGNASTASGNIAGNGSLVLKLYYTRDSYAVKTSGNNTKAGTYTQINGDYRYEKKITLTATTNTGYTFLGWFDGTTCVSEDEQFTYNVEKKVTLMATWEANEGVAYKVEYYLQNLDDNKYPATPTKTETKYGKTDDTVTVTAKTFAHFTYDENASTANGIIAGNGLLVLKLYYTRDSYTVETNGNNVDAGTYTQINGNYRYEKQLTLKATTYAGYEFLGWYDGGKLVSQDEQFKYNVEKEVTLTATWAVEVHDCEFTDYVSNGDATCTKDGTETAECNHIACEKTHTRTDVGSASHDFTNYKPNDDATCTEDGTETAKCNRCTAEDTRADENSALGHSFTDYKSNNDATYEKDGTKTAECDRDGCKVKDTVTDEGSKLVDKIEFNTLNVDGYSVSGRFNNATVEFNFNEEISVYGSLGFVVAYDKNGENTTAMRIATLAEGDNTYYVIVMKNYAPVETYTVSLYRNKLYTVSFENDYAPTQQVDEDDKATEPQIIPEKAGYTFTGWDFDFSTPITEDTIVNATWEANTDTAYTVEYYLQNLDGSYPTTPSETYGGTGTTDTTANADIKAFTHFIFNDGYAENELSGNIADNGSLVLKVYYTRDSYTVATNGNNAKAGTYTQINAEYSYEEEIALTATTNAGYTFLGWFDGTTCVSEGEEFTYSAEKDVTLTATWAVEEHDCEFTNYNGNGDGTLTATCSHSACEKTEAVVNVLAVEVPYTRRYPYMDNVLVFEKDKYYPLTEDTSYNSTQSGIYHNISNNTIVVDIVGGYGEVSILNKYGELIEGRDGVNGKLVDAANPVRVTSSAYCTPSSVAMNMEIPAGGMAIVVFQGFAGEVFVNDGRGFVCHNINYRYGAIASVYLAEAIPVMYTTYRNQAPTVESPSISIVQGSKTQGEVDEMVKTGLTILDDNGTFTASDDASAFLEISIIDRGDFDVNEIGEYTYTCTVTDGMRSTTFTRVVKVIPDVMTIAVEGATAKDFEKSKVCVNQAADNYASYDLCIYTKSFTGTLTANSYGAAMIIDANGNIKAIYDGANGSYLDANNLGEGIREGYGVQGIITPYDYLTKAWESLQDGEILIVGGEGVGRAWILGFRRKTSDPITTWIGTPVTITGITIA